MKFDVLIIGGGAAGISALAWCVELGLDALLLEACEEFGGQLLWVHNPIKNYLGIETENGRELRDLFIEQTKNLQSRMRFDCEIAEIDWQQKIVLSNDGEKFSADFLIIAAGIRRRKLHVEGEEKFKAKGIIESGKRDENLAHGKNVLIVGGGDAAFENALILSQNAVSVTLTHRSKTFRARAEFVQQARKNPKIEILTETIVRKITGDKHVEKIEFEHLKTRKNFEKKIELVLIRIGVEPNTDFLSEKIELDADGYICINQNCETNIEGVFAVGDIANPMAPTVSGAIGMGATAAKTALFRYRQKRRKI